MIRLRIPSIGPTISEPPRRRLECYKKRYDEKNKKTCDFVLPNACGSPAAAECLDCVTKSIAVGCSPWASAHSGASVCT
jgi:hypothetical protein